MLLEKSMRISISKLIPAIIELVLKLFNCHIFQISKYQGAAIYHKQGVYSTGKQKIFLLKIHMAQLLESLCALPSQNFDFIL